MRARGGGVHRVTLDVRAHAGLTLVVPAGTFFHGSPDGAFQNMIVTSTLNTPLVAGSSHEVSLTTACANFHRRAPDQPSATILLAESVRLLKEAKATSAKAGKALNMPWPLQ